MTSSTPESGEPSSQTLLIACGALSREIIALIRANQWTHLTVQCLPADLHNRPTHIPGKLAAMLEKTQGQFAHRLVAYADCGTGGQIDAVCQRYGVAHLPGNHCYDFYAGINRFAALMDEEIGTFFFTDFMVRHFERIIWQGMGLADDPSLLPIYFQHYRRVVYLAQVDDADLLAHAQVYADRLGLPLQRELVGYGLLEQQLSEQPVYFN